MGGSYSFSLLSQQSLFTADVPRIAPNDIVGVWIGTNDIWTAALVPNAPGVYQPVGSQPSPDVLARYTTGNVRALLADATARGARNVMLVGVYDLGQSAIYDPAQANAQTIAFATAASVAYNDQLRAMAIPGVNVHFLDTLELMRRVQANPGLYGFTGGTTATNNCIVNGCANLADQRRFVFFDTLHLTSGFQTLIGRYVANLILAPESVAPQAELAKVAGHAISDSLLGRLEASRFAAPFVVPVAPGSPFGLFASGLYGTGDRGAQTTVTGPTLHGFDYALAGATVGGEYRGANAIVGAAFNYAQVDANLRNAGGADTRMASYQGAIYGSLFNANAFLDATFSYGANRYQVSRDGVVDTLTASPTGTTFAAAAKAGYLFDLGALRIGPIAGVRYASVQVDAYSERGDPLLTMGVRGQTAEELTGSAGAQIRTVFTAGGVTLNPYVNVTAEHDFDDSARSISSFQTNAPLLLINTDRPSWANQTYGRVTAGLAADFSTAFTVFGRASATFGRARGDDFILNGGLAARF